MQAGTLLLLVLLIQPLTADATAVDRWLAQPCLQTNTFETEVQRFLKSHIPRLQVPASAVQWEKTSVELRREILERIVLRNVPTAWHQDVPQILWGNVLETDKGYRIRKLKYEALPGLWVPALLYEPAKVTGKIPAILNVNGHIALGKAEPYEQIRCINLAKRGMLAFHPEFPACGELQHADYRHNRMAYLDLCGINGVAVFYLIEKRALDVLEMYPLTDSARIGMTGLSGGGWQTIFLSSLDRRISTVAPNAGYIGMACRVEYPEDRGDLEQNPTDLLTIADYSHLTAMLAPRPALLIYNQYDDCCFASPRAWHSIYEPVVPFYQLFNKTDAFQYYDNLVPGTHNYDQDNRERFYGFIDTNFAPRRSPLGETDAELPTAGEILQSSSLDVGLPNDNATFFTLARDFMNALPRNPPPDYPPPARARSRGDKLARWQRQGRERLRQVLRLAPMTARAALVDKASEGKLNVTRYGVSINGVWTVPAVVIAGELRRSVAVLFADQGKAVLTEQVQNLVANDTLVVAVDPIFMGECVTPKTPSWKYAQMVSAVGQRPLGLQVGQLSAIVDWVSHEFKATSISLYAVGWNASVAALCACALHQGQVDRVSLRNHPTSLKALIEKHRDYASFAPLFCYGLLEQFDVRELTALCWPVQPEMASSDVRN